MIRLANGSQSDVVLFEESMMSVAPAALILIIAPFRLAHLYSQDVKLVNKDTRRQEGDWRVYRFYGSSMGWIRLALYGTCIICNSTFAGLQSKSASCALSALADQAQQAYGLVSGLNREIQLRN